jgi:hypothetical protein
MIDMCSIFLIRSFMSINNGGLFGILFFTNIRPLRGCEQMLWNLFSTNIRPLRGFGGCILIWDATNIKPLRGYIQ